MTNEQQPQSPAESVPGEVLNESAEQVVRKVAHAGAGWLMAMGVAMVVVGSAAIILPHVASLAVAVLLGLVFLVVGVVQVAHAFHVRPFGGYLLNLLLGALYGVLGVLLLANLYEGVIALTVLVALFFVIEGVVKIAAALQMKRNGPWGWTMFSGVLAVILAVVIFGASPEEMLWVLGLLVGINLIFRGWSIIALGSAIRAKTGE